MPFFIPEMPLAVNIWRYDLPPPNPPAVVTVGNLSFGKRSFSASAGEPWNLLETTGATLLLPKETDIRDFSVPGAKYDQVEVPAGSGRFYTVIQVDDFGKGFANEHRFAVLRKAGVWPVPIP